jgi:hypothetical protein
LSFLREFFQEEEPRISRRDTDKGKRESAEFMAKSRSSLPQKSVFLAVFLWEITNAFHPDNSNRGGVFVRFYPCPSVKSVVQFLWLRQYAAPSLCVKKSFDLTELPNSANAPQIPVEAGFILTVIQTSGE